MKSGPEGETILAWDEGEKVLAEFFKDALIAYGIRFLKGKPYIHVQIGRPEGTRQFYLEMDKDDDMALVRWGIIVTKYVGSDDDVK